MSYCADTNILLRWVHPGTVAGEQARQAAKKLRAQGETVYITPQNLVEFWSVATRPVSVNGLGLTPEEADAEATTSSFSLGYLSNELQIAVVNNFVNLCCWFVRFLQGGLLLVGKSAVG